MSQFINGFYHITSSNYSLSVQAIVYLRVGLQFVLSKAALGCDRLVDYKKIACVEMLVGPYMASQEKQTNPNGCLYKDAPRPLTIGSGLDISVSVLLINLLKVTIPPPVSSLYINRA